MGRAKTNDTARLLTDLVGVTVRSAGGFSSLPVMHGMADDRLLVKTDGVSVPSSCPNHINSPLSYIDASKVDSVQTYHAASPVS